MKKDIKVGTCLAPVPVVMVSCKEGERENITTVAWTGVINSEPPFVYISLRKSRLSYEIIQKTKEFVINIPNDKLVVETDYCGTKSGREVDKWQEMKLTKEKAQKVDVPMIAECPIQLECEVKEIKELGSHDMLIAEVVAVHAEEEYVKESGAIDYEKANLLTYAGTSYLTQNRKVATRGVSVKEK